MIIHNEKTISNDEILLHIDQYIRENGYSPTVRELCMITGKSSTATIQSHLKKLKERKLITYKEGKSRTIRILGGN